MIKALVEGCKTAERKSVPEFKVIGNSRGMAYNPT